MSSIHNGAHSASSNVILQIEDRIRIFYDDPVDKKPIGLECGALPLIVGMRF